MLASGPRPTVPGSGSEFTPWNAQPLVVTATQEPAITARRNDFPPIMASLRFGGIGAPGAGPGAAPVGFNGWAATDHAGHLGGRPTGKQLRPRRVESPLALVR